MTSLKDEIEKIWKEYASSVKKGDLDRWIKLWIDDGIQMPPNAPLNIGKEKISAFFKSMKEISPSDMVINSEEVREAGDWGFSRGNYWLETAPKEGEITKLEGKFLTIFEKQDDGSWKIARDIFNFNA
ncbi:YybH family protein [Candidatus Hodarchaeum mangrovi]|nr:SgcJ/EcaC family oxidoreductase [Asgard group archaeon]